MINKNAQWLQRELNQVFHYQEVAVKFKTEKSGFLHEFQLQIMS